MGAVVVEGIERVGRVFDQVVTGGEGPAGALDHDDMNGVVFVGPLEPVAQFRQQLAIEGVEAVWAIEGQPTDVIVVGLVDQVVVCRAHGRPPE